MDLDLNQNEIVMLAIISVMMASSIVLLVIHGWPIARRAILEQERRFDVTLNQQLLMDIPPRIAIIISGIAAMAFGMVAYVVSGHWSFFPIGAGAALWLPKMVTSHMEAKRRKRLDLQIIDGITTLASGVRAGLNLVQSLELLARNANGPIQQETQQLLREYQLGMDLNVAMKKTADRIGSGYFRLLFAAIQAHREKGGDMGQSLDRIGESIREIQRLEGRLDALTAQGRAQARFMTIMPAVLLTILYLIDPESTERLFSEPMGRVILLTAVALIMTGAAWIRRIMSVDI